MLVKLWLKSELIKVILGLIINSGIFNMLTRIVGSVFLLISATGVCHADNCSDMQISIWTPIAHNVNLGAIFSPTFNAGFVAQYEATSGRTATYTLPTSVGAYATNASPIRASALLNNGTEFYTNGYYDELTSSVDFYLTKSGQGCVTTLRATPLSGSTTQNIGGDDF